MGPRAITQISVNWKSFGLGIFINFDWRFTVIILGPLTIDTQLGFVWKLVEYQEWFYFYKADE